MKPSPRLVFVSVIAVVIASQAAAAPPGDCGGTRCRDGQFCYLPEGVCDPSAMLEQGICADIPLTCDTNYAPVCGCNDVTYHNSCFALQAEQSIESNGECPARCGGFGGVECPSTLEYCALDRDGCCCDLPGTCEPPPVWCPSACQPVCGCDDALYRSRCQAEMNHANVKQEGACGEAYLLKFVSGNEMTWSSFVGNPPFNVYRKTLDERPPADYGDCIQADISASTTLIEGNPAPGELWLLQVTSERLDGGDSMGYETQACSPRVPAAWCSQ